MKIKKFIINRKIWGRGREGGYLLNNNIKKYCCLGIYAKKCGFKDSEIQGFCNPEGLIENGIIKFQYDSIDYYTLTEIKKLPVRFKKLFPLLDKTKKANNVICGKLANANDSIPISDSAREKKITNLFKKIGISVEFKGKYD